MSSLRRLLLGYAFILSDLSKFNMENLILLEKPLYKAEKNREDKQRFYYSFEKKQNNYFPKARNSLSPNHIKKNEYFKKEIN